VLDKTTVDETPVIQVLFELAPTVMFPLQASLPVESEIYNTTSVPEVILPT